VVGGSILLYPLGLTQAWCLPACVCGPQTFATDLLAEMRHAIEARRKAQYMMELFSGQVEPTMAPRTTRRKSAALLVQPEQGGGEDGEYDDDYDDPHLRTDGKLEDEGEGPTTPLTTVNALFSKMMGGGGGTEGAGGQASGEGGGAPSTGDGDIAPGPGPAAGGEPTMSEEDLFGSPSGNPEVLTGLVFIGTAPVGPWKGCCEGLH
jgi:hypothetical protein